MKLLAAAVAVSFVSAAGGASAQVDLSGEWSARYHEDQDHRIPGPELGDYTGLPINDAARLTRAFGIQYDVLPIAAAINGFETILKDTFAGR